MSKGVEAALADCLARLESGEATLEEALCSYPELRPELEPLLVLAMELRSAPKVSAPEGLRSFKRPVFATPAVPAPTRSPLLPWGWRVLRPTPAWATPMARLAAGVALSAMLLGGTMVASAGSLPEEPLYPLKLAVENAQMALTPDPQRRAELEIQFAGRRLQEVEAAARQGKIQAVEQGLALYEERVEGAVDRVQTAGTVSQGESQQFQESLAHQQEQLFRVYEQVPAAAQPAILHAMEVSQRGVARSGKKPGDGEEKAAETPKSTTGVPTPPAPTRVVPADLPGKGHEPQAKARLAPVPTATEEAEEQPLEKSRGDGRRGDGEKEREKDASGLRAEDSGLGVKDSSQSPVPSHLPWKPSLQGSTPGIPTSVADNRTSTPSPVAAAGGTPSPLATAGTERNRQEGSRERDGDRSSRPPATIGSDDGRTDDDKGKNGRDGETSFRGPSR